MKKGTKTTIVGILLAIVIISVIVLKYFGKLGENLSETLIAITGLLTALGFFMLKIQQQAIHTIGLTIQTQTTKKNESNRC